MPGLLEGAHAGVGLGHQFLRHCQRCRVLVHVIDGTSRDPMGDYRWAWVGGVLVAGVELGWGGCWCLGWAWGGGRVGG